MKDRWLNELNLLVTDLLHFFKSECSDLVEYAVIWDGWNYCYVVDTENDGWVRVFDCDLCVDGVPCANDECNKGWVVIRVLETLRGFGHSWNRVRVVPANRFTHRWKYSDASLEWYLLFITRYWWRNWLDYGVEMTEV